MEGLEPLNGYVGVFDTWEEVQQFIVDRVRNTIQFYVCFTDGKGRLVYHAKYNTERDAAIVMLPPDWRPSLD